MTPSCFSTEAFKRVVGGIFSVLVLNISIFWYAFQKTLRVVMPVLFMLSYVKLSYVKAS